MDSGGTNAPVPNALLFLVLRRYFIRETAGAVKA